MLVAPANAHIADSLTLDPAKQLPRQPVLLRRPQPVFLDKPHTSLQRAPLKLSYSRKFFVQEKFFELEVAIIVL
jgi:hypothetical protein